MRFDAGGLSFDGAGLRLDGVVPLVDGEVPDHAAPVVDEGLIVWELAGDLAGASVRLRIVEEEDALRLLLTLEGLHPARVVDSLGVRFANVASVRRYLRNGYTSWDGSFFAEPGTRDGNEPAGRSPTLGYAMTALLPVTGTRALVIGFTRHDRFQSRFRFGGDSATFSVDAETLIDRVGHYGACDAEPLLLFAENEVEEGLRRWSHAVAAESPLPPRLPKQRITGWCSWYNLYAAIDERSIREHLAAAAAFRDEHQVPLNVFQIDDGFTPEMGDWLDTKPQFPRGMRPLLAEIDGAGFTPGLWIAPFMVGNRSRLFAEHPDWLVRDRDTGAPITHLKFYGEFRWHKRSEEYYILDVTHPEAAAYIRGVFRTWRHEWGCRYFKTDFMHFGSEYGPDRARWHRSGLSRIAIWRLMATLIREEIGDALWLGCGCPLWASVGLVDAVRIGRDIGVSWTGDYSAQSLLRDQQTRNHASGILWQGDPDCILLRDRFHDLTDDQVRSLALYAGLTGGVLMTSDKLDELPPVRAQLFASLLRCTKLRCAFPNLGADEGVVLQRAVRPDGSSVLSLFNAQSSARGYEQQTEPHRVELPPFSTKMLYQSGTNRTLIGHDEARDICW